MLTTSASFPAAANQVTGTLRGDHDRAVAFRKVKLSVMDVEAVGRENDRVRLEVRTNLLTENLALDFVRQRENDDIRLLDRFLNGDRLKSGFNGELIILGALALGDDDLAAAVAQVLSVGVSLRTVAQHSDRFVFQDGKVRVGVIVFCRCHNL